MDFTVECVNNKGGGKRVNNTGVPHNDNGNDSNFTKTIDVNYDKIVSGYIQEHYISQGGSINQGNQINMDHNLKTFVIATSQECIVRSKKVKKMQYQTLPGKRDS